MNGLLSLKRWTGGVVAVVVASALGLGACEQQTPEVVVVQPAPPGVLVTEVSMSAANVAALALAATNSSFLRAQTAQSRVSDPQVRAFAGRVAAESQLAGQRLRDQLVRFGITPIPEATAQQIESNAAQTVALMQSARGLDVDRIYLDSEITSSRWLREALDSAIAGAMDANVQSELLQLRTAVDARLHEAERLRVSIG